PQAQHPLHVQGGGAAPPPPAAGAVRRRALTLEGGAARAVSREGAAARQRLVVSQGDPAGIGPELLLRLAARPPREDCELLFVAERAALEGVRHLVPEGWERLVFVDGAPVRGEREGAIA